MTRIELKPPLDKIAAVSALYVGGVLIAHADIDHGLSVGILVVDFEAVVCRNPDFIEHFHAEIMAICGFIELPEEVADVVAV